MSASNHLCQRRPYFIFVGRIFRRQINGSLGIADGYLAAAILKSFETFCITGCLFRGSKHDIKHSAV